MHTSDREPPRPAKLWRQLAPERRLAAALAFVSDSDDMTSQAEAVEAIARHLKFRPKSVLALPAEKRARHLASLPSISDSLAGRLLVSYHLAAQRPLMSAFLNALGVPHEHGLITADEVVLPDAAACRRAARELESTFPPADVSFYVSTLLVQDPDTWGPLAELVRG